MYALTIRTSRDSRKRYTLHTLIENENEGKRERGYEKERRERETYRERGLVLIQTWSFPLEGVPLGICPYLQLEYIRRRYARRRITPVKVAVTQKGFYLFSNTKGMSTEGEWTKFEFDNAVVIKLYVCIEGKNSFVSTAN